MQFNSYSYLLLLIPAVQIFWLLPPAWRRWYVLAVSLLFYATWSIPYVLLPMTICGVMYGCGLRILANPSQARRWMWLGIGFTLTVLAFFKFGAAQTVFSFALPLGISFYSFEAISYLIDTRQGRVKQIGLPDLLIFITFWPHLIAGPIVRTRELIPQLSFRQTFEIAMLVRGLDRIIWGLVQKNLFANSLGSFVDEGFLPQAASVNTAVDNWFLAFAFGLQIYFDFAAYSNIAIGSAELIGITLPENFRFPYHAANPADFWSRWHMTLSRWIRDYLFFPVNARFKGAPAPLYLSLIGIMALIGLWHGAGWGFVLWGVLHGIYLVLFRVWESRSRLASWAWRAFTIAAVTAAWIPFRAAGVGQAIAMLRTMILGINLRVSYSANFYLITILLLLFIAIEPYLIENIQDLENKIIARDKLVAANLFILRPLAYAAGLLLTLAFDDRNTRFIYFQF